MINLKKYQKDWKLVQDITRTYDGDEYFWKILMHRKTGVALSLCNELDRTRYKIMYRMEMFYLDPKTGKELEMSPIWERHEIKEDESTFMHMVEEILDDYTRQLSECKSGGSPTVHQKTHERGHLAE
jgi:hypothetical protein